MVEFTTCENEKVDLDDKSIYPEEHLKMNVHDLFSKCMQKAGYSLFYMGFLHKSFGGGMQEARVRVLCEELACIWRFVKKFDLNAPKCTLLNEDEYRMALLSWSYRFEDETENQC